MPPKKVRAVEARGKEYDFFREMAPDNLTEFHRAWMAEEADREAVVAACLEAHFKCGINEIS